MTSQVNGIYSNFTSNMKIRNLHEKLEQKQNPLLVGQKFWCGRFVGAHPKAFYFHPGLHTDISQFAMLTPNCSKNSMNFMGLNMKIIMVIAIGP